MTAQLGAIMFQTYQVKLTMFFYLSILAKNCWGTFESHQLFVQNVLANLDEEYKCEIPTFITIGYDFYLKSKQKLNCYTTLFHSSLII